LAEESNQPLRLQKLLAAAGLASRRTVEQWIEAGRVTVNGRVAQLGDRAAADDDVRVDGSPVALNASPATTRVIMYNKPVGEVTTRSDPQRRPTVFERLPQLDAGRWIAIGRLDVQTSGLLLFTTDGALANRLMHPSNEVEREYVAVVRGRPAPEVLDQLLRGVELDEGPARFDRLDMEGDSNEGTIVRVVLHEGRNREVRRLFAAINHHVLRLARVRYGPVKLPRDLAPGKWREVPAKDVGELGSA
jgi:23S rRNA pseudouridine2605 synthase